MQQIKFPESRSFDCFQDLTCLIERYLEPLKDETYISSDDVEQLFGNIQEIVQFQRLFLHCLEDAICSDPNFNNYNDNRLNVRLRYSLSTLL